MHSWTVASSVSAYNAGKLERILLMKHADEYFKMKEAMSAADRPDRRIHPPVLAMITQLAEAVSRPSAFRPKVPNWCPHASSEQAVWRA